MPKSQPTEIQRLNWQRAAALRALQCADAQVDGTLRDYGTNVNEHHYRAIKDAISALCQALLRMHRLHHQTQRRAQLEAELANLKE